MYHVPKMLKTYCSIKQLTGQEVEKCNDDKKIIYHRKTNKHSTTTKALRVRQRKYMLKQYSSIKRKYRKLNTAFFRCGGKPMVVAQSKLSSYHGSFTDHWLN